MTIELAAPPKNKERRKYKHIIEKVIAADGQWLRVSLDEIAPVDGGHVAKQSRIMQAARLRGYPLQTTFQDNAIFIRLVKETA